MDEAVLYFALALLVGVMILIVGYFTKKSSTSTKKNEEPVAAAAPARQQGRGQVQRVGNRRAPVVRNRGRDRIGDSDDEEPMARGGLPQRIEEENEEHSDKDDLDERLNDPKLGAKKRAKLEAKAEKKAQREAEERIREKKKIQDAKDEQERLKRVEEEAEIERKRVEEEKRLKEEKERRDLEEYAKLKESFVVEEEGCDILAEEEEGNLVEKFINHIKTHKVILFEELATHFNLKVPDCINRVNSLVADGRITGVMDDRGKFIYISEEELNTFAKFIKQRGRVSIAELVENSTSIVNLKQEVVSDPL